MITLMMLQYTHTADKPVYMFVLPGNKFLGKTVFYIPDDLDYKTFLVKPCLDVSFNDVLHLFYGRC